MRSRALVLLVVLMVLFTPMSAGLMEYFSAGDPMSVSSGWSKELKDLVGTETRVLGILGPIVDYRIYCAGDTEKLNAFLEIFAEVPDAVRSVVLHPGSETVKHERPVFGSDGSKSGVVQQTVAVDWSLHITEKASFNSDKIAFEGKSNKATLDIWIGGQIELDKLLVPSRLSVRSSGEMEAFIRRHEEKRSDQSAR